MSSILTPGERPGIWDKIGDLARRVARLEAVPASGPDDDDVLFNDPNTTLPTRYLTVVANDDIPADDASIRLEAAGSTGDFDLIAKGNMTMTGEQAQVSGTLSAVLTGGGAAARADSTGVWVQIGTGQKFYVVARPVLPITAVNQGTKQFTVAGDYTALFPAAASLTVSGSTGNDGVYTVVVAAFGAGNTVITVVEAIPSAVANGSLTSSVTNVFEVRDDGTVHILTGTTVQSDL